MWKKMAEFAVVGGVGSACGAVAYGVLTLASARLYENTRPQQKTKILYRDMNNSLASAESLYAVYFIMRPFEFTCHVILVLFFLRRLVRHASHSYNSQAHELKMTVSYTLLDCVGEYVTASFLQCFFVTL